MSLLSQASLILTPNAYKSGKLYSIVPISGNGDLTFTRATSASRINSSEIIETVSTGVPRLDYSGSTPSILLEPQRTNLNTNYLIQDWTSQLIKTINFGISPENIQNSTQLVNTGVSNAGCNKTYSLTSGTIYTFSLWIKKTSGTFTSNTANVYIYPQTPSVNISFIDATTSWKRYSATFTSSTTGNVTFQIRTDVASAIEVYGVQLEVGSYPTSIIPTVASTVTRNADIISRNNLYTNGLITSLGGTFFIELNNNLPLIRDASSRVIYLGDSPSAGSGNGFYLINSNPSAASRLTLIRSVSSAGTALYTTLTDTVKLAVRWNGTTADVYVNSIKIITSTSFTTTIMEYLYNTGGGSQASYIKSIMLFPTPLTDAECESLTTL